MRIGGWVVLLSLARCAWADRTFTLTNSCSETIWPGITNYGANEHNYTGELGSSTLRREVQPTERTSCDWAGARGWESAPGNVTTITLPSIWNGRICGSSPAQSLW